MSKKEFLNVIISLTAIMVTLICLIIEAIIEGPLALAMRVMMKKWPNWFLYVTLKLISIQPVYKRYRDWPL